MSSVDNRVVKLTFDNGQFEKEISRSQTSLGNLDKALSNAGGKEVGQGFFSRIKDALSNFSRTSSSALSGVQSTVESFTTDPMISALNALEDRFSSMGIVGMSVLDNLADAAFQAGSKLLHALGDPIIKGGYKRAQAIENARFTLQGLVEDEAEVDAIMKNALNSVDGTAYAYDDAAMAAANFAATGIKSGEQMEHALQGIAGTAATVNGDYSEIAHIFTTIAGNGRIMGDQLNQFANRGLNASATVAKSFNEVINGTSTLSENSQKRIRGIISSGSKYIKNTSKITEQDIRELASKGLLDFQSFADIMYDRFGEHAKKANDTFTGSMANIRSALARTGAMFYTGLIVQKGPLVRLFNAVRESINAFNEQLKQVFGWDEDLGAAVAWTDLVTQLADGATTVVTAFTKNGGIEGIGNILKTIGSILKPIGDAFDAVFGYFKEDGTQVKGIAAIAEAMTKGNEAFRDFTQSLILNEDAQKKLQAAMEIVFDILKVGCVIIKNVVKIAGSIFNVILKIAGAIADFVGTIIYILNAGRRTVDILDIISTAIDFLGVVIRSVIRGIGRIIDWIAGKLNTLYSMLMGAADSASGFFASLIPGLGTIGQAIRDSIDQDSLRPFFEALRQSIPLIDTVANKVKSLWNKMNEKWNEKGYLIYQDILNKLSNLVDKLREKIAALLSKLKEIPQKIHDAYSSIGDTMNSTKEKMSDFADTTGDAFGKVKAFLIKLKDGIVGFFTKLKNLFGSVKNWISEHFTPSFLVTSISSGAFAGYFIYLISVMRDVKKAFADLAELPGKINTFFDNISNIPAKFNEVMGSIGDTLETFQQKLHAEALLNIALAIGVLAASLWVLSQIPTDKLLPAIGALAAIIAALVLAMKAMTMFTVTSGSFSLKGGKLAASFKPSNITQLCMAMIPMALAILALGAVIKMLAGLSWEEMGRGIAGMGVCLVALVTAIYILSKLVDGRKSGKGILTTGAAVKRLQSTVIAMLPLAISVFILGKAMAMLGQLSPEQLIKGGLAVAGIMVAMGAFMRFADKQVVSLKSVASLVILAGTLYILAGAILVYAAIPWEMFAFGIEKIAVALLLVIGLMHAFPNGETLKASASLAILAGTLYILAGAIVVFSLIPADTFANGLVKICIALAALAGIMFLFGKAKGMSLRMAASIAIISGSLIVLGAAFALFSLISLGGILKGLVALAGTIAVLGFASTILAGAIPFIVALAGALALIGLSIALVGGGLALIAWGFVTLGAAGAAGAAEAVAAITIMLDGMAAMIPQVAAIIVMGMLAVAQQLALMAPSFAKAMTDFFYAFHDACSDLRVKLKELGYEMLEGMADVVIEHAPILGQKLSQASVAIIEGLIPGIKEMGNAMTELVIAMMTSLKDHIVDVSVAGADLAVALVEGIADGLENAANRMEPAMEKLRNAIIHFFKAVFGIHSPSTVMADEAGHLGDGVVKGLNDFIDSGQLGDVMGNLGDALSDGFTNWAEGGGIKNMINSFSNTLFGAIVNLGPGARETGAQLAENFYTSANGAMMNWNGAVQMTDVGTIYMQEMRKNEDTVKHNIEKYGDKMAEWFALSNIKGFQDRAPLIAQAHKKMQYDAVKKAHGSVVADGLTLASAATGGILKGFNSKQGTIGSKIRSIVASAKSAASGVGFSSVGSSIVGGIVSGMSMMSSIIKITSAARNLVKKAKTAAQNEGEIQSPSKLFQREVGAYIAEGMAVGIYKKASLVEDASKAVIRNSVRSAALLADKISDAVDYDLYSEPVITPVVDLTDVINKSDDIFNMLGGAYAYAMSSNIIANRRRAQDAAALASSSSGNVVNQYNNMKIIQQPGESMDMFVNRVVGKLETATNMEG